MRLCLCLLLLLMPASSWAQKPAPSQDTLPKQEKAVTQKPPVKTFNAQAFSLANGMQVVVVPNHRAPVVSHMIWYKVGRADEKPGASGMAHYLEHLLFKGTEKMAPGAYSKRVRVLGGDDNAFTGQDFTAFYANVAKASLPEIMRMEADRMLNVNPPPEHFASEKTVVLEERRQRTENDPRARFGEQLNSLLYINHPYGIPVIGWMDEIKKYDWADVKNFYDAWYAPNNAILVVSGDITAEELKPLVEEIYAPLAAKDLPPRARPHVPPAPAAVQLDLYDPNIHQPVFQMTYLAPANAKKKKDSLALQVLEEVMGGGPTTRLYDSLVVKQKKAVSVGLGYDGTALDYGTIGLYGTPAEGVSLETLHSLMRAEIDKVIQDGVTKTETDEAIKRLQEAATYARDSLSGPAMIIGYGLTTGSSLNDIENWPANIATVTPEDVQRAAKTYLNAEQPWIRPPVIGYLQPKKETAKKPEVKKP